MFVRLAFSVAINVDPDILLLDEVLAVGDGPFQEKCLKKMYEFRKKGITIIFVSHNPNAVKEYCDRVIYLKKGKNIYDGPTEKVMEIYKNDSVG